jgi:hypothetical protein
VAARGIPSVRGIKAAFELLGVAGSPESNTLCTKSDMLCASLVAAGLFVAAGVVVGSGVDTVVATVDGAEVVAAVVCGVSRKMSICGVV